MAKTAVDFLRRDSSNEEEKRAVAQQAVQKAVQLLAERGRGTGGLILLDRFGTPAFAFNTPRMAYGLVNPDGSFVTAV
jgi:isoaspartyl peptidase/L-asparaginase-like protein (Ntn-hydrolase superfamily)